MDAGQSHRHIHRPGGTQLSTNVQDSANGLGDIEFWPFMLGWTNGDIKYDARCAIYAPSGSYNAGQLANVGLGYWTFEPELTFSRLSSKIGTEFSVFTGMDFNTINPDTQYKSGDIVHADGTLAQHLPLPDGFVGLGANGFYYKQVTGDSGSGATLGSFKAESAGVGPVISYIHQFSRTQLAFETKWLREIEVDNTTRGNYVRVKLALVF